MLGGLLDVAGSLKLLVIHAYFQESRYLNYSTAVSRWRWVCTQVEHEGSCVFLCSCCCLVACWCCCSRCGSAVRLGLLPPSTALEREAWSLTTNYVNASHGSQTQVQSMRKTISRNFKTSPRNECANGPINEWANGPINEWANGPTSPVVHSLTSPPHH